MAATTVPAGPRRRVVRGASPAADQAYDAALSELPPEIRPLVRRYAEHMNEGQKIRSELSTAMTANGLRWRTVDEAARALFSSPESGRG